MLINLTRINYTLGGRLLLNDANVTVNPTDRIALIGRNGCGKSTLLQILAGHQSIDAGIREVLDNTRILLIKQELPSDDKTPLEYLKETDEQLIALTQKLEESDADDIGTICEEIEQIESERYGKEAILVLLGLGISKAQQESPMRELSGGIRMRIALASALLQQPDVLLLDEPTNHLDLPSIIWLTEYLKTYPKPFVVVSHDRALLTAVINTTYHLENGQITCYNGDFNTYIEQRQLTQEQAISTNINTDKKVKKLQQFVASHKANPKWARIARTREGWIEKLENDRPDMGNEAPPIPIAFQPCEELRDPIFSAENCSVFYGDHPILSNINLSIQTNSRIGILGRNGEGKSTLVRMMIGQLVRTVGSSYQAPKLHIAYFSQEQSDTLTADLTVFEQLKSVLKTPLTDNDILNHLLQFGFAREQCRSFVGTLSGGEKTRLSFAMIAALRPQLIIMDEPTNHLDFETKQSLISAINTFNGAIVLVSHDWELLEKTISQYWLVSKGQVRPYGEGLEHYKQATLRRLEQATGTSTTTGKAKASNNGLFALKPSIAPPKVVKPASQKQKKEPSQKKEASSEIKASNTTRKQHGLR